MIVENSIKRFKESPESIKNLMGLFTLTIIMNRNSSISAHIIGLLIGIIYGRYYSRVQSNNEN